MADAEETTALTRETVYAALRQAIDPVYGVSVVELGVIAGVAVSDEGVTVDLFMPYTDTYSRQQLINNVALALQYIPAFPGGGIRPIEGTQWDTSFISPTARRFLGFAA